MAPHQVILEPEAMGEIGNTNGLSGAGCTVLECSESAWLLSCAIWWGHSFLHLLLVLGGPRLSIKKHCKERTVIWAFKSSLKLGM